MDWRTIVIKNYPITMLNRIEILLAENTNKRRPESLFMLYWWGNTTLSALGKPTRISRRDPSLFDVGMYITTCLLKDFIAALMVVSI